MSLHASNYNSSEYNNKVSSHRLFQQRCRSRSTQRSTQRTAPSTSRPIYSTLLKLQPHYFSSSTSSDSLSSLIKLINHHHYLHIIKGQLAVPSSRSHRPIPPTSISRPRLNHSHGHYFRVSSVLDQANQSSSIPSHRQRTAGCSFITIPSTYSADLHLSSQTKSFSRDYFITPF